jgi:Spy/CpxP family protein refolding chaperone
MKRITAIFVVVICALALASSVAFADQCSMGKCNFMSKGHKMRGKKGQDEMFLGKSHLALAHAAELGLNDDQVSKIKALEYNFKKSSIKEDADIKSLGLDIREAIQKDTIDTNAVNSLVDQKYSLKAAKAKEAVQAYANLKKILTKDQYDKLKEMRHHGMRGKMGRQGDRKEGKEPPATQEDNE